MLDQAKLIKQAWDMKRQMEKVQKEMSKRELVIARQGVTVKITGALEVRELAFDPAYFGDADIRKMASAAKDVVNIAIHDAQDMMKKELGALTGGMKIPGLT